MTKVEKEILDEMDNSDLFDATIRAMKKNEYEVTTAEALRAYGHVLNLLEAAKDLYEATSVD